MVEIEIEIDQDGKVVLKATRDTGERPVCTLVQELITDLNDSGAAVTDIEMDRTTHGHRHEFRTRGRA